MAFRMSRPIIKGTKQHKASIAKARTAVPEIEVEQTRTKADPTLVETGRALGESYMPKEIDFSIPGYDVAFSSEDDKEKKTKEKKKEKKKKEEKKVEKKDGKDGVVVDDGSGKKKKGGKKKIGKGIKNIIEKIKTSIEKIKSKKKEKGKKKEKEEVISIEKKDIKKLPEKDIENKPKKVEETSVDISPKVVSVKKHAHENPDYKENWQADKELGKKWIKYDPQNPGYSYDTHTDAEGNVTKKWTYRGREVDITEVPEDFIDQVEEWEAKQNAESVNKDNQQNNQQNNQDSNQQVDIKDNENTSIDSTQEDKGFSDATIDNKRVDTGGVWQSEKKPHPRDFKGTFWEKQEMYKKAQKEWWKNHGHMQKFGKPHPDNE